MAQDLLFNVSAMWSSPASLDKLIASYIAAGITQSTTKYYKSAHKHFHSFCTIHFSITDPFSMSESLLCYFAAYLAREGLAPTSIKLYLSAVPHMQVVPEPRVESSLPRLRLVLTRPGAKYIEKYLSKVQAHQTNT